jgi:uncharacterized protein (DUF934 family)
MPEHASPKLIRNGQLEDNPWVLYQPDPGSAPSLPPDAPGWMIELPVWRGCLHVLVERECPLGIVMPADGDYEDLILDAEALRTRGNVAFLAIRYAHYGDGRGYSLAWMLRQEYGWSGDLRAVGDVLIDTVHYLARCGFTSFVLKQGHDPELALESLRAFSGHYQPGYANSVA